MRFFAYWAKPGGNNGQLPLRHKENRYQTRIYRATQAPRRIGYGKVSRMRSPSYTPYQRSARAAPATRAPQDALAFLRANDKMAALMPAVTRMAALQTDCAAALPAMFEACAILQFEAGQLVLSTPNAALAAKLKQQLPKLQETLQKRGWQIDAIRLKVQVIPTPQKKSSVKQLILPQQARSALAVLADTLEDSPRNAALKAALDAMARRNRD